MAIWVTEYLVMACNPWYEEVRDGRFWPFSDALFGCVKQLKPEELAGDDAEDLGFFQATLALRVALPVHDKAFHDAVGRLDTSLLDRDGWLTVVVEQFSATPCYSMLWRDVTLQFVLYFDFVFDVIACI